MNKIIFSLLIATFSTLTANLLALLGGGGLLVLWIDILIWFASIWSIQISFWLYKES